MLATQHNQQDENLITQKTLTDNRVQDPLKLDLKDDILLKNLKNRRETSKAWFNAKLDLDNRVERNVAYSTGKRLQKAELDGLKPYEGRYQDNVIWEAEETIRAIAFSKMPDVIVKPGKQGDESQTVADNISEVIDYDLKRRERREVLQMAFDHEPQYLRGVIKTRWNPELGKDGDYDYEWVLPSDIIVDHTAKTNDQRDMDFIAQNLHPSIKEMLMRFPDKEKEILKEASNDGVKLDGDGKADEKSLATKPKEVWETWFSWYEKKEKEGDKDVYERIEGVAWTYRDTVLKKMKDPNWDWEGEPRLFSYSEELSEDDFRGAMLEGEEIDGLREERVFRNFFLNPEKPYIFLNSQLSGESPINDTSRLEQLILMQYSLDVRGKIINEKLLSRKKNVWSKESGLKAEDIEEMDPNDPDEDVLADGNLNNVHKTIDPDFPTAQEFKDYGDNRDRMFAKVGVFGSRGEIQSDTATSNQIGREQDFTRTGDLADRTINYAAERMARWALQHIKLRYNEDHFTRVVGEGGKTTFQKVNRDMVEDGMEVAITSSGTDKLKAERRALEMAKLKLIDPHQFYKDIGASDPQGRTLKLMTFLSAPEEYTAKYGMGLEDSQQMGNKLNGEDGQQALLDIQQLQQGQQPQVPKAPTPEYVETFKQFIQSPEFQQLPPQIQQLVNEFAQEVIAKVEEIVQNAPGEQFGQGGAEGGQNQQPSATNTTNVATEAPELPAGSTRNL